MFHVDNIQCIQSDAIRVIKDDDGDDDEEDNKNMKMSTGCLCIDSLNNYR